jgi:hypothetical protein
METENYIHVLLRDLFSEGPVLLYNLEFYNKIEGCIEQLQTALFECFVVALVEQRTRFKVSTRYSRISAEYLRIFSRNLLESLLTTAKYLQGEFDTMTDTPDILFHGTTKKFLPVILKEGLNPAKAGLNWKEDQAKKSFLTDSMYIAEFYALKASMTHGGEPAVLEIDVQNLKNKLHCSAEHFDEEIPRGISIYKQFACEERIPPNRINNHYIIPKTHLLYRLIWKIKKNLTEEAKIKARHLRALYNRY